MPRPISEYPNLAVEELIEELVSVTGQLKASLIQRGSQKADYERAFINRYYQSQARTSVERDREAQFACQQDKADLTEFEHQVESHTVVRDLLVNLIQWRMYGSEQGSPWVQERVEGHSEETRRFQSLS